MNLISRIKQDHIFRNVLTLEHIVYMYIISDLQVSDGYLFHKETLTDLLDNLKRIYEFEELDECIRSLEGKKLIIVNVDDFIEVGVTEGRNKVLYSGVTSSWDKDYEKTNKLLLSLEKSSTSFTKALSSQHIANLNKLYEKPTEKWATGDFVQLFKTVYFASYQEEVRGFTAKEIGQIKNLQKFYDNVTYIRIIITYLFNADAYGKGLPSPGQLNWHKDTLYGKINGVATKREIMRTTDLEEEF